MLKVDGSQYQVDSITENLTQVLRVRETDAPVSLQQS